MNQSNSTKLILAGILGLSLNAQAREMGIPLIRKDALEELSKNKSFMDMTQALLDSKIIKKINSDEFYFLDVKRLKQERRLAQNEGDLEIKDILDQVFKSRINISFKVFKEMFATTQDHLVNGSEADITPERFKRD